MQWVTVIVISGMQLAWFSILYVHIYICLQTITVNNSATVYTYSSIGACSDRTSSESRRVH